MSKNAAKKTVTVIEDATGRPAFAVVPWADYERLRRLEAEDDEALDLAAARRGARGLAADRAAAIEASRRHGRPIDALAPAEVVKAILAGAGAVKSWREHRGLTQAELARRAGVSRGYLAQIETGARAGTAEVLSRLARELGVLIDHLVRD